MFHLPTTEIAGVVWSPDEPAPYRPRTYEYKLWICDFAAVPESVPVVRRFVRTVLIEWRCSDETVDNGETISCELATNALNAMNECGAGDAYGVKLMMEVGRQPEVSVWDPSPGRPHEQAENLRSESGRGLTIVDALASSWGIDPEASWGGRRSVDGGGKWVWAVL